MKAAGFRQVAFILGPVLGLFYAGLFAMYSFDSQKHEAITRERASNNVIIAAQMLTQELRGVTSDLQYLAGSHEAVAAIQGSGTPGDRLSTVLFVDRKQVYDEVIYLDITGMERFRVNYDAGQASEVPKQNLRFKGNRYYFAEGLKLMYGDVYISPLNLSVEHGVVERPLKPMIRFVTPINDENGARIGLLVLGYLGQNLLDVFSRIPVPLDDCMMLLNDEGYWLKCQKRDNDWGFMFQEKEGQSFQTAFPDDWRRMEGQENGQFVTDYGLMTFSTLCLADAIPRSKTHNPEFAAGCWKIVSLVNNKALYREQRHNARILGAIGVVGSLFLAAASLVLVHFRRKSQAAELSVIKQNVSFARFVPKEFLRLIGKGNLQDVELGTSVEREVGVLFSDIRSYTTLSETLTSRQVFEFLNDYFVFVSEPVAANQGFIDIFIGDALMALFPRSAEDALKAAIQMRLDLRAYNDARRSEGQPPVHSGYGLHWGEVTLGTIGSFERMQTTAIGDTVNLASRIESVTKTFKMEIVLSDGIYSRLPDPQAYLLREIDTVRVKGKQEPVTLYECFDADPEPLARGKAATRQALAEAMALYKGGAFEEALEGFKACAETCPEDSLPAIYIKRCNTLIRIPPGDDWAGVSTL